MNVEVKTPPEENTDLAQMCRAMARRAKAASERLNVASTERKNQWLRSAAVALEGRTAELLEANGKDIAAAPNYGLNAAAIDRLTLTPARLTVAAEGLRQVAALPDPVGEVRERATRPNGLDVMKVGAPIGVVFFIYESRPHVTVDAAALCVKSGNAVILRGGKEASTRTPPCTAYSPMNSRCELPRTAFNWLPSPTVKRSVIAFWGLIDSRSRGGKSLITRGVRSHDAGAEALDGNCHIYVDAAADLEMAERIVVNAKCQRPGVCNAAESLLIHARRRDTFLPRIGKALAAWGRDAGARRRETNPVRESRDRNGLPD